MTVSIRPLKIEDAYMSVKWRNDPEVFRYTGNTYDHVITIESELAWIKRVINKEDDYRCAIEVDGVYVGNIYLTDIHDKKAEYHIFIGDKNHWGRGVAKKASFLLIKYAKEQLGLGEIVLEVQSENHRAINLYQSLGFVSSEIKDGKCSMVLKLKDSEECMVAIHCLVYNHEPYLRDCFEGFVMQKTNFRFVAIVHEDCSTDNSAAIIREYEAKYPDIFRPIYETENQYSKPDGSLTRIMNTAIDATGAKYVAICEGDDYWTDPYKLQKQVDFLESHPDFSMCCHGADVKNETLQKVDCACEYMTTREYFPVDAFPTWQIPTASIVYRREKVEKYKIKRASDFFAGDVVLILTCMHVGRVWGFEEHMSVYRVNAGGVTRRAISWEGKLKFCKHYEALVANFPLLDTDYCHRYIAMVHYTNFHKAKSAKEKLHSLSMAFRNKPSYVLRKIFRLKSKPRNDVFYQHYKC